MRVIDPRLLRRSPSARRFLVASAVLALLGAAAIIAQASLLASIADRVFLRGADLSEVAPALGLLAGVAVARGALAWASEALGHRTAAATILDLRRAFARRVLIERPGDTGASTGAAAATAVQGVDALDPYFARYLPALATAAIVPAAILAWVATIDLLSAAVMLATIPLIPIFGVLIGRTTSDGARARYAALGRLSGRFLDIVRGLTTLRAFNRGAAQADGIAETGEEYRRETMRVLRVAFLSSLVLELAASLSIAVIAVEIGVRLVGGSMAFAPAFAVLILAPELYQPLRNAAAQFHASADGLAAAERILDAVDGAPARRGDLAPLDPREAPIRFEGVDFAYPARPDAPVLRDASFSIAPGERVAVVGPSGIGKSTIARLLLRFDDPDAGRLAIGDRDLADVDPDRWRERIAWVPQRPALTSGTIAEAIALGRPDADRALIAEAARAAGAAPFIANLPEGLDTRVGDGGAELSTGQTRRVALARALLRDAPLLLLDEPTTSLDAESATIVADALEGLPRDRSMLLITHDPELAARIADRTLLVDDGRLRPLEGARP